MTVLLHADVHVTGRKQRYITTLTINNFSEYLSQDSVAEFHPFRWPIGLRCHDVSQLLSQLQLMSRWYFYVWHIGTQVLLPQFTHSSQQTSSTLFSLLIAPGASLKFWNVFSFCFIYFLIVQKLSHSYCSHNFGILFVFSLEISIRLGKYRDAVSTFRASHTIFSQDFLFSFYCCKLSRKSIIYIISFFCP